MLFVKVLQDDPQVAVAPLATQIAVHWVSVMEINQELLGKGGQA
jgi:acid phosphatase class B